MKQVLAARQAKQATAADRGSSMTRKQKGKCFRTAPYMLRPNSAKQTVFNLTEGLSHTDIVIQNDNDCPTQTLIDISKVILRWTATLRRHPTLRELHCIVIFHLLLGGLTWLSHHFLLIRDMVDMKL